MAFDSSFKDKLRSAADIVEVISERISVQKKGSNFMSLCPFHADSKPSMNISPTKQIYKCFACGAGGDVFTFLMEFDHLSFPETVKYLANKYHLELPEEQFKSFQKQDDLLPLKDINARACEIYQAYLMKHKGGDAARKYLNSRKIAPSIVKKYKLGYAPAGYQFLMKFLEKDFDQKIFGQSGLFGQKDSRFYDFFRDRLIFPIISERGDVLGFGGRVIGSGEPKYLNTSETFLFQKKKILYGLPWALKPLAQSKTIFIVEGYLDAIACLEAGLPAVAPLGTALTEEHLLKLKRYAEKIILLFDGDTAGIKAAERASLMLIATGASAEVVLLVDEKDPFDFLKEKSAESFKAFIQNHKLSVYDFLLNQRIPKSDLSPGEKSGILDGFVEVLARIENDVVRGDYLKAIAKRLGLEWSDVESLLRKVKPFKATAALVRPQLKVEITSQNPEKTSSSREVQLQLPPASKAEVMLEINFILLLLENPGFFSKATTIIGEQDFRSPAANYLFKKLLTAKPTAAFQVSEYLTSIQDEKLKNVIERKLLAGDMYKIEAEKQFEDTLCKFRIKALKNQRKSLDDMIKQGQFLGDEMAFKKALEEKHRLNFEIDNLNHYFKN